MNFSGTRNKMIILFIALYLAASPGGIFLLGGQAAGTGEQKILVHVNKPVYVAGEMFAVPGLYL